MPRYKIERIEIHIDREPPFNDWPRLGKRGQKVENLDEVRQMALHLIPDDDREHFLVMFLSSQNVVLGYYEAAAGSGSSVMVHPGEIMRAALLAGARRLLVIHNHPAGSELPSVEDRTLTTRLGKAAKLLGLVLLDHLIVSHEKPDWCWSAAAELPQARPVKRLRAHESAPWPGLTP